MEDKRQLLLLMQLVPILINRKHILQKNFKANILLLEMLQPLVVLKDCKKQVQMELGQA